MVGETLGGIRERIESLTTPDGAYRVVCARTGIQPVPVSGSKFPDRERAEQAAQAATAYRAVLRRWDPRAPCYDFIACEVPDEAEIDVHRPRTASTPSLSGFCHDVAAAVFEALTGQGLDSIESEIMDAYCESADAITDPDQLCLHLLATLSAELDERLDEDEQARVLSAAAESLHGPSVGGTPLAQTFERLQRVGIVDDYSIAPQHERTTGSQRWTVTVDGYALPGSGEAIATLPVVIDLLRRLPRARLALGDARRVTEATWQFEIQVREDGPTSGLTRLAGTGTSDH